MSAKEYGDVKMPSSLYLWVMFQWAAAKVPGRRSNGLLTVCDMCCGKFEKRPTHMAVGQNPGTPVNIQKAFKIDYLGRVIIPKKVP